MVLRLRSMSQWVEFLSVIDLDLSHVCTSYPLTQYSSAPRMMIGVFRSPTSGIGLNISLCNKGLCFVPLLVPGRFPALFHHLYRFRLSILLCAATFDPTRKFWRIHCSPMGSRSPAVNFMLGIQSVNKVCDTIT